ncbi:MAG: hypothetical protein L3K02_05520 [Thermoplasmata archaeon]|nr:hypothetical protein [Thermoplasmata archaeon]
MTHEHKSRRGGMKGWLLVTGIAILFSLALAPALTGAASAASPSVVPATTQWAYGGQGNSTGNLQVDASTITWNASFGWTVIFTATNTSNSTVQLEEQRTVGIDLTTTLSAPNISASYTLHGTESDLAFVNLTDAATVYVNGTPVPAVGIDNESLHVAAAVDQAVQVTLHGHNHGGWLNVSGSAQGVVSFTPALGLVPLNLSGVDMWNSSATSSPAASWNINYAWADLGWNGTTRSGSGAVNGSWNATGPVSLIGLKVAVSHPFNDHKVRTAVILLVQGPVDAYDGYLLVPHDFDLFGGAAHPFDSVSLGSATIGSGHGETLYLSPGARGPLVSDADSSYGATPGAASTLAQPTSGPSPAANSAPGGAVPGQPMTVAAAQAESACLTNGCPGTASAVSSTLLGIAVIALAVVAVVGTVAVIEWRSYARRRTQKGLVGGYGESWTNGVPPAAAQPPSPPTNTGQGPQGPRMRP